MKVLFVCTGNTCRSPLAEGYLKHKSLACIEALSAGTYAEKEPASENSILAARQLGFDISGHISRPLEQTMLDSADKIYCMTDTQKELLRHYTEERKISVMGIPDPYGKDLDAYLDAAKKIAEFIDNEFPEILRADDTDCAAIAEIEKECFSSPWSKEGLIDSLNNGLIIYKAEIKNKIIGYVGINTVLDEGSITNIAVLPEYRNKGTAMRLLETLERDLGDKLSFITLEVRVSNNAAISLYQKMGYEKAGGRKNFYIKPNEDAFIMTKGLK